ncbi:hypothetical protein ACFUNF_21275 [Streptomyces sp. NPDC057291]
MSQPIDSVTAGHTPEDHGHQDAAAQNVDDLKADLEAGFRAAKAAS